MAEEYEHPLIDEVRESFTLKTLQERVWRLESENKELKVNNSILQTQYTSQCETQADILRTLHANLEENYTRIEELELKNQKLEQQLEDQKQEAKDELEAQKAQSASQVGNLQQKCEHLENELQKVNEFRENKASMEAELASLKARLQQQAEEHTSEVSTFDRKKAMEIDQLRKDMDRSIEETKEILRNRTKDQLDTTTKRTIMENEQMATELHFQSKETERLLARNQALLDENSELRRSLLIHKDLENELARRTHVYQKLIKKMDASRKAELSVEKSGAGESSVELLPVQASVTSPVTSAAKGKAGSGGGVAAPASRGAGADLEEENERMRHQVTGMQSTLQMVRQEFAHYRRDHATLTQLQDQSTRLIIAALYELKNQRECDPFPPASYDENANWQFTTMTSRQKEYFFRVLLEKLNSSMCGSCFPSGQQSVSTSSLPPLGKASVDGGASGAGAHLSQFLWSVATHGAQSAPHARHLDIASKSVQTETAMADPCLRGGQWSPHSRNRQTGNSVTASVVTSNVRPWGPRNSGAARKSIAAVGHAV